MNHRKHRYLEIAPRNQVHRGNENGQRSESSADICPGFDKTTIEWAMSRITLRPRLDLLTREYLFIASCVTLRVIPQLRMHIASALKLGATRQQVVEVIRHMISYAGGPAVAAALNTATEVFQSGEFA
jgi:4-carboxymuconolactone decarboxylase